ITGVQFNASTLPKWATEETAERIAILLEASLTKKQAASASKKIKRREVERLTKEMGVLRRGTRKLTGEKSKAAKVTKEFAGAVSTAAGAILGSLAGAVKKNVSAYLSLYDVGINLGDGLFKTAKMVHQAG